MCQKGVMENEAPRGKPRGIGAEFFRSQRCRIPSFVPPCRTTEGFSSPSSPQQAAGYSAKENKANSLWAAPEEIALVITILLTVIVMISCSRTKDESSLLKRSPDFYRIDINQATWEELDLLPGIGAARAQKIIEYRTAYGEFRNSNDLRGIPGIPDKVIHKIKYKIVY